MPHLWVLLSNSVHFSGAKLGGTSTHGEPLLAILLMMFMTTQEPSNWGSKWRLHQILVQDLSKLALHLSSGTSHTISGHVFLTQVPNARLGPSEWSMYLIKPKTLRGQRV